jgi:hypothetical protein
MPYEDHQKQLDYLREYKKRPAVKTKRAEDAKKERLADPSRIKRNIANYKERLHKDILKAYGGRCVCCSESHPLFLTLDHINNDGAQHRKSINCGKGRGGTKFYAWVKRNNFPNTLQLLCWNCNCGKHRNGGTCPHKG